MPPRNSFIVAGPLLGGTLEAVAELSVGPVKHSSHQRPRLRNLGSNEWLGSLT